MVCKMKILLLGEYSGLFTNLKIGFENLGYDVCFYHNGDGKKNFEYGVNSYKLSEISSNKVITNISLLKTLITKLKGFDIVYVISPRVVCVYMMIIFFYLLKRQNKKVFILSCGDSFELFRSYKNGLFRYYMYDYDPKIENNDCIYANSLRKTMIKYSEEKVFNGCNGIIPCTYEYSEPFTNYGNLKKIIPFPFYINDINKREKIKSDKIVVYHGVTEYRKKGSYFIIEAMKRIQEKYPDKVEIIINEIMPYAQYKETIKRVDIVIDQCKSYAWGMNAILSMAEGKVVLSGAEKETLDAFGLGDCPVINITPSVEDIENKLEYLILNRDKIEELSIKGKEFVADFHDCVKVAKRYLEVAEENR